MVPAERKPPQAEQDRDHSGGDRLTFEFPNAELVFGIVCAVGGNYRRVEKELGNLLKLYSYESTVIRFSSFLPAAHNTFQIDVPLLEDTEYERIKSHMDVGNSVRDAAKAPNLLALTAISEINRGRTRTPSGLSEPKSRRAHILVTLKRTEEVDVLRRVYGPGFFLIGVYASERERRDYLMDDFGMSESEALELIRKDEEDVHPFGQQTREAFHRADVFVRLYRNGYKQQLKRFLELVFRHPYHTPTPDEHGMFLAFASSLRSAQLGRQVGAAILNSRGDTLAVGCNEVPRAGGGSYWPGDPDSRDHKIGRDSNDSRKDVIANDILDRLKIPAADRAGALRALHDSLLFDITEFGRAVHAEMDAILSCGRCGISPVGATLYTSTFPCHNCARHIIASGLQRVVFIEPYPKSQAGELHKDSIRLDHFVRIKNKSLVPFDPFVGIGPRRYSDLFAVRLVGGFTIERKDDDGRIVPWSEAAASPRLPLQPISYLQREQLAADELERINRGARTDERQNELFPRAM
jgi:deoxycytidylate deaminase